MALRSSTSAMWAVAYSGHPRNLNTPVAMKEEAVIGLRARTRLPSCMLVLTWMQSISSGFGHTASPTFRAQIGPILLTLTLPPSVLVPEAGIEPAADEAYETSVLPLSYPRLGRPES